jgi:predicted nuclease of restriction endonuclease-like (RecB) superfamily
MENITVDISAAVEVIKSAILQSQIKAVKAVNQEQLALYYGIGRYVSYNTRNKNWGKGVIDSISEQLKKELPGLRGFSAPSMRKMRTFYEEWKCLEVPVDKVSINQQNTNSFVSTNKLDNSFVPTNKLIQAEIKVSADFPITEFMSISFSHHYAIVSKVKDIEQRKFYIRFACESKVKVEDLEALIDDDLYSRRGSLPNNFTKTIPDKLQAFRAISMFKDEYLLDFINVEELFVRDKDQDERVVEQAIVHNVKNFIMTFGNDFTFVGNQYRLEKYGEIQFPDLLFFNRELKALVCVELKSGPFKTAYLGQLAGYLRILDDEVRKPDENPSIGILLCSNANSKFVEYVIQDYDKPMGVATYRTTVDMEDRLRKALPDIEQLKALLAEEGK